MVATPISNHRFENAPNVNIEYVNERQLNK